MAETAKQSAPSLVVAETGQNGSDNVIMHHKKPPFDNVAVRRAISLAMDRHAFVQGVRHGGAVAGAALMPPPFGAWGLPDKDLRTLPGYRDRADQDKAEARQLLAAAGFGPGKPLRVELVTRALRDLRGPGLVRRGPAPAGRRGGARSSRSRPRSGSPRSPGATT